MFGVVLGIHLRESVGDDREVRLRFANGNPALQVTQHEPIFWEPAAELSFRAAGLFGEPQVRIAPGEARRHDADQRARRAVQDERGIEYLGVCAEAVDPDLVAQDKDRRCARLVVGGLHHAPQKCRHAHELQRPRRHQVPVETLRPPARSVENVFVVVRDHPIKCVILLDIVEEFGPLKAGAAPRLIALRVVDLQGHQAVGIGVRERLHEHVVDHAEDRRGSSDAQRQRDHGYDGETRALCQRAHSESNVLSNRVHRNPFSRDER